MDTKSSSNLSFHTASMEGEFRGCGSGYEGKCFVHGVLK